MVAELTPHIAELGTGLLAVGGLGVAASLGIVGLSKGWAVVKKLVKG